MKKLFALLVVTFFAPCLFAEPIWIDVRSAAEHKLDSIEGDIRITHTEVVEEIQRRFPDKNTEINLYCRSGGRAGMAKQALVNIGYTQVTNAGGINEVRELRED